MATQLIKLKNLTNNELLLLLVERIQCDTYCPVECTHVHYGIPKEKILKHIKKRMRSEIYSETEMPLRYKNAWQGEY